MYIKKPYMYVRFFPENFSPVFIMKIKIFFNKNYFRVWFIRVFQPRRSPCQESGTFYLQRHISNFVLKKINTILF